MAGPGHGPLTVESHGMGSTARPAALGIVICAAWLQLACDATPRTAELVPGWTEAAVLVEPEVAYPRLRFPDGSLSLNDRCPVRKVRLNPRMPPLWVNGKPIGFC